MDQLPWLVVHGACAWKAIAALAGLAAGAWAHRRDRARARQLTAAELAIRLRNVTGPAHGPVSIRGTLRGGGASSLVVDPVGAWAGEPSGAIPLGCVTIRDQPAAGLWLACGGERVELDGALRVVRGTSSERTGAVAPIPRLGRNGPTTGDVVRMGLADGDDVVVTAMLAPRASREAGGYRDAVGAWTATPVTTHSATGSANAGAIDIIAVAPSPLVPRLAVARAVRIALTGGGLALVALFAIGRIAIAIAEPEVPKYPLLAAAAGQPALIPGELGELAAVAIAAATPGIRARALDELEHRFALRYQRTRASLARWRDVADLRDCGHALDVRVEQEQLDGLAARARSCDDVAAASRALAFLGLFAEAAQAQAALPIAQRALEPMIATSAWQDAADWIADAHAQPRAPVDAPAWTCAQQWLQEHSQTQPARRIPGLLALEPRCELIATLTRSPAIQAGTLAEIVSRLPRGGGRNAGVTLAWAAGAPIGKLPPVPASGKTAYQMMFVTPPGSALIPRALLAPLIAPRIAPRTASQTMLDIGLAMNAVLRGDPDAAARQAADLAGKLDRNRAQIIEDFIPAYLDDEPAYRGYAYGAALAAGVRARFRDRLAMVPREPLERRTSLELPLRRPAACGGPSFSMALLGMGDEVSDRLAACGLSLARGIEWMFVLWPLLPADRAAIAEQIRMIEPGWHDDHGRRTDPFAMIEHAALRRDLARMIGDTAYADDWQALLERYLTAFGDRDRLTALLVRDLVAGPAW